MNFPTASPQAGLVSVILTSQRGKHLGQTNIEYYGLKEVLKEIVQSPSKTKTLCEEYSMAHGFGETAIMEDINETTLGKLNLLNSFLVLRISWRWEKLLCVTVREKFLADDISFE